MKKYIPICAMLGAAASMSAQAADIYVTCKVYPAMVKEPKETDAIDGIYSITDGGTSIKIGSNERGLPLNTSEQKYEWQWTAERNGTTLTMREEINRVTGQYAMYIDGPKGTIHAGKGTCRKAEPML